MPRFIPNQFTHLSEVTALTGPLPKPWPWRMLHPSPAGAIHALPSSRGLAVATNGILVAIAQQHRVFIGHLEHFVPDTGEPIVPLGAGIVGQAKAKRRMRVDITEFV